MLSLGNIEGITSLSSNTYLDKGFALWQADIVGITMATQAIASLARSNNSKSL